MIPIEEIFLIPAVNEPEGCNDNSIASSCPLLHTKDGHEGPGHICDKILPF